MSFRLLISRFR